MGLTARLDLRGGRPCWNTSDADAGASDAVADGVHDVAIVGAGIMGAMLAERLTRQGLSVAILDRRAPSHGATSASTALVMWGADTPLTHLAEQIGWAPSVRRWRSVKAAVESLSADLKALRIDCGWRERPELYLAGDLLFRRVTTQRIPRAHVVALAALAALVPAAGALTPALLSVATSSVLVAVAAAETFWRREAAA